MDEEMNKEEVTGSNNKKSKINIYSIIVFFWIIPISIIWYNISDGNLLGLLQGIPLAALYLLLPIGVKEVIKNRGDNAARTAFGYFLLVFGLMFSIIMLSIAFNPIIPPEQEFNFAEYYTS